MEEYNKSYEANNHTSLLSHAQSQSPLTSWYPNCYESQGAFSSGHLERTSLPHRSGVFLGVIDQQPRPSNLPTMYKKHGIQKDGSEWRQLMPGHQLCNKDPSQSPSFSILIYVTVDCCIFKFWAAVNHWLALLDHCIVHLPLLLRVLFTFACNMQKERASPFSSIESQRKFSHSLALFL